MRRVRGGEWVRGQFEVVRVEPSHDGLGSHTVTGHLVDPGAAGTEVCLEVPAAVAPPAPGARLAARWRRGRPGRARVEWAGTGIVEDAARVERDRRAAALGLDPAGLGDAVPPGMTAVEALTRWAHDGELLPDGTRVVSSGQADRLRHDGEPAEAVVAAVEHLRASPGTAQGDGPVANAALDVTLADGTTYRVLARLRFDTAEQRRDLGRAGVQLPVRVARDDRTRVVLDLARSPAAAAPE